MFSLAGCTSFFNTDPNFIDDCILLTQMMMADTREFENGVLVSETPAYLAVSFQVYQWSLGYNVLITDPTQRRNMLRAIQTNKTELQPHRAALETLGRQFAQLTHFGGHDFRAQYRREHNLILTEAATAAEESAYQRAVEQARQAFSAEEQRAFRCYTGQHPNRYLQEIGLKQLRLTTITPLYLD